MKVNWKPVSVGGCIGAVCALSGAYAFEAVRHARHIEPSSSALAQPLKPAHVDTSWIKSGNPKFHSVWYTQTPKGGSGIWTCQGPATFEWKFGHDEEVYILEGEVRIDYLGNRFTLRPGESAKFLAGTKATWHVPTYLKKSFTVHRPSKAAKLYRKLFGAV